MATTSTSTTKKSTKTTKSSSSTLEKRVAALEKKCSALEKENAKLKSQLGSSSSVLDAADDGGFITNRQWKKFQTALRETGGKLALVSESM